MKSVRRIWKNKVIVKKNDNTRVFTFFANLEEKGVIFADKQPKKL